MADVHFLQGGAGEVGGGDRAAAAATHGRARRDGPRSDVGTIVLHWGATIALFVSLFTGLRISADAEGSVFAKALDAILPGGEIWTPHVIAAVALIAIVAAYPVYMRRARLAGRVAPRKALVLTMPASRRMKWGGVNVLLHWLLFADVAVLAASGVGLYLGKGGVWVQVHYVAALTALAYVAAHLVSHFMYGGLAQWLRLFRPTALAAPVGKRPLAVALGVGAVLAGGAAALDYATRETLVVGAGPAPKIDGVLDDPAWAAARMVAVDTQQGVNLAGGLGESRVEMRAVRHGDDVTFAFRWEDPTRSLKRLPLVKREDGWHLLHNKADIADESVWYEDKFAVMFSRSDAYGSGGSTHMGGKPLADKPAPLNGRGYHYTADGSLIDVWQWKASRGGHLGHMDDMWFAAPVAATPEQVAGKARYQAGYDGDKGRAFYTYNYVTEPPGGYRGPVKVKRLPKDWRAMQAAMGPIEMDPARSDPEGQAWWLFEADSQPWTAEADAAIPVGTVMPAVLIAGPYDGSRGEIRAAARWRDGHWTLEATRKIATGQSDDLDLASGLYVWVSVFDRNQTRHTRHMRPVRLEFR